MPILLDKLPWFFKKKAKEDLRTMIGSIDRTLNQTGSDIQILDMQYIIYQSTGIWLKEYGSWFGLEKNIGENDENYRARIMALVTTPKDTIPALLEATQSFINTYTGINSINIVEIYEPFSGITYYNDTKKMIHIDRFSNNLPSIRCIMDIMIYDDPISDKLVNTLLKVKGGGITLYFTRINSGGDIPLPMSSEIVYSEISKNTDVPSISDNDITIEKAITISKDLRVLAFMDLYCDSQVIISDIWEMVIFENITIDGFEVVSVIL